MLKITFLGTGTSQGVPVISCQCDVCYSLHPKDKRLRSSVLIETDNHTLVVDCGPDFRQQMLRENVKNIDAVLLTHEHKDHMGGIDDLRAFNYTSGKPIDIYCEMRVQHILKKDFDYAFAENRYPGVPEINLKTITDNEFYIDSQKIIPIRGYHYKLPVLGFRIDDFCYLTDMNRIEQSEYAKMEGVKVLVINALRKDEHISHFTLNQALEIIKTISPQTAYLTHVSHQMGRHEELESDLPENVHFAYDGLKIKI